ncbi:MAG: LD-carboxypeptidase [Polaromonas sp.]
MKKTIYIYSPSSAINDKASFKRGIKCLESLGYEVEIDETALLKHQRFAGNDAIRIASIHRAASSGANIALISRGGYGLTRILPDINYKTVAKAINKGTKFVGFSDFTAFQMAVLAKTGEVTWAGPVLTDDFGAKEGVDEIMQACFEDLTSEQGEGCGWRLPKFIQKKSIIDAEIIKSEFFINEECNFDNAVLWGGNLAMICSLLGTPYMPAVKNGILFIEDVGEHPYRVERMLAQLLQAGILAQQKAIVFGQFNHYKLVSHDKGYKLASVIDWLRGKTKAKILTGLPFGHVATKVLLPIGLEVSLNVEGRDAFLLWGHQH